MVILAVASATLAGLSGGLSGYLAYKLRRLEQMLENNEVVYLSKRHTTFLREQWNSRKRLRPIMHPEVAEEDEDEWWDLKR